MARQIPFKGFVGSAFGPQSPNIDCQELINWYLEYSESPFAKKPSALLPCPGFEDFATLPQLPVRGIFAQNDRTFAVGNNALYEVTRSGTIIHRAMTVLDIPVAPTITNSPLTPAIAAPTVPIVTHGGTLGATIYGYRITAINDLGETTGSVEGTSAYGNATLSATNYNAVAWAPVDGASGYKVYRTTGPGSGVLVGVVPSDTLFFNDIGTAGTAATPPVSNTTGGVIGATTYGYKVVALLGLGHTAASGEGQTLTGQATLDEDNFNTVTWPAVTNAHSYEVYRTTGGVSTPPVLLGTTDALTFDDVGSEGESATPPTSSTTGTATLVNDGAPVSICSSGDAGQQLLIISAGGGYLYDLEANTLAQVVDGATSGGYIGSYFVILDAATSTLKCSESLDGFAWDSTQIYQRTSAGDRWLAMCVTSNDVFLIGSNSADVYRLTGDNDTRFAPFNDITVDQGIIATSSLDLVSGSAFMMLGQNSKGGGIVWLVEGYQAKQVSTRGLETEFETYTTLADAVSFSYSQGGHHFYVLTFPSDERTWVYDQLTGEWHRRGFYDPNDMRFTAYRPQCHAFAFGGVGFGYHLVGDSQTGRIAAMSTRFSSDMDDDSIIRRVRQSPHLSADMLQTTAWALVIDLQVGKGTATGQGANPQVMLQISKDGGTTWGKEIWRPAGRQGKYLTRVKFARLGSGRDWVFRIVVTDPIMWQIAGAYFEPEEELAA